MTRAAFAATTLASGLAFSAIPQAGRVRPAEAGLYVQYVGAGFSRPESPVRGGRL
jgi:hypothetical protein